MSDTTRRETAAYDEGDEVVVTRDVVTAAGRVPAGARGVIVGSAYYSKDDKCYKYHLQIQRTGAAIGGSSPAIPEDAIELLFEE